jgi:hypothetical protein
MASRRYRPRPYQPYRVYSRRPAGSAGRRYQPRPYRPQPYHRHPAGGGFLAALLDLLLGRRR